MMLFCNIIVTCFTQIRVISCRYLGMAQLSGIFSKPAATSATAVMVDSPTPAAAPLAQIPAGRHLPASMADRLSDQERVFVSRYLSNGMDKREAGRYAGYKWSNPVVQSWQLLHKAAVREVIERELDRVAMGAREVVARLSLAAEGVAECLEVEEGTGGRHISTRFDLLKEAGKLGLIKKIKYVDGLPEVEFTDPVRALELLGKAHGIFSDRVNVNVEIEERRAGIAREVMRKAMADPSTHAKMVELAERLRLAGAVIQAGSEHGGSGNP